MPNRWLVKTDPRVYAFADLEADGRIAWRGVTQPLSMAHLAAMRRGDDVFVYHSGAERAVVGIARVQKGAYPDPEVAVGRGLVVADLRPVSPLDRPVALAELKTQPALAGWALVRIPRIHVVPVPTVAWRKVLALSRRPS